MFTVVLIIVIAVFLLQTGGYSEDMIPTVSAIIFCLFCCILAYRFQSTFDIDDCPKRRAPSGNNFNAFFITVTHTHF